MFGSGAPSLTDQFIRFLEAESRSLNEQPKLHIPVSFFSNSLYEPLKIYNFLLFTTFLRHIFDVVAEIVQITEN